MLSISASDLRRLNRTQVLVLFVLAIAWIAALGASADLLRNPAFGVLGGLIYQLVVTAGFALVAIGVLRRWRWLFFALMVLFLLNAFAALSVAANISSLRSMQALADSEPFSDYLETQIRLTVAGALIINLPAVLTGIAMLIGLRRAGVWGAF